MVKVEKIQKCILFYGYSSRPKQWFDPHIESVEKKPLQDNPNFIRGCFSAILKVNPGKSILHFRLLLYMQKKQVILNTIL